MNGRNGNVALVSCMTRLPSSSSSSSSTRRTRNLRVRKGCIRDSLFLLNNPATVVQRKVSIDYVKHQRMECDWNSGRGEDDDHDDDVSRHPTVKSTCEETTESEVRMIIPSLLSSLIHGNSHATAASITTSAAVMDVSVSND